MYEKLNVIYLAGGCFWGVEAFISRLKGVNQTEVGYANGIDLAPTYEKELNIEQEFSGRMNPKRK